MELLERLHQTGMTDYLSGLAGQISGMITEIKSAAQVVEEIVSEAIEILQKRLPADVKIAS